MALKETFAQYMVINPSIEIYLLDLAGKFWPIRQTRQVKRNRISLEPINEFIRQAGNCRCWATIHAAMTGRKLSR